MGGAILKLSPSWSTKKTGVVQDPGCPTQLRQATISCWFCFQLPQNLFCQGGEPVGEHFQRIRPRYPVGRRRRPGCAPDTEATQSHGQTCQPTSHLRLPLAAGESPEHPFHGPPHAIIMALRVTGRLPGGHCSEEVVTPGAGALKENLPGTLGVGDP